MRGRGVGTAIMEALLDDVRAAGARLAVLTSSAMGNPLNLRLGFTRCCTVGVYEYQLST
jgi:N-acetylglutamate synthase and related acetyltransferases